MPLIDHTALHVIATRVFSAAGSEEGEAKIIADHLIGANLRGHDSHGVGLIPNYLQHLDKGTVVANRKGRVVSENGSLIVYDGERAWGQVAAREATLARHRQGARHRGRRRCFAQPAPYRPGRHLWRDVRRSGPRIVSFCQRDRRPTGRGAVARQRCAVQHQPGLHRDPRARGRAPDHPRHGDERHCHGQGARRAQQGRAVETRHIARRGGQADRPTPARCIASRAARC